MKKCTLFLALLVLISCTSLKGSYEADVYDENLKIIFEDNKNATVILNDEVFTATYLIKDGIIEVWQERKIPPIYLKKLNPKELVLLNKAKNETQIKLIHEWAHNFTH